MKKPKVMPCYITYYAVAYGNGTISGVMGLYLPIAFRYSHLDTRYNHHDTSYSHLQLAVVVLKHLYNCSNHLATGYKYILFLQASFRISMNQIITATATCQEQSRKGLIGRSLSTITFEVGGLSPSKKS